MTTIDSVSTSPGLAAAAALAPQLAERAADHDRDGSYPEQDFHDLRDAGLLALMVPTRLGGLGAGFADYARVAMELGAGSGATALIYNMHASVTGALAGTPDEVARVLGVPESYFAARDRILAATVSGSLYSVAMSERGVGSRLSALTTTYEPVDGGYRLVGAKAFVSGAGHADGYLVAARTHEAGEPRVSHFLVPAGPGLRVEPTWDSLGMRATGSHDLHLDTVVPADALLGGIEGLAVLLAQAMPQWLVASYAAVYVGVAQACIDACAADVSARGLGHLPAVRARLGRADAAVAAARLVVLEAAARVDTAPGDADTNRWVWRAKLAAGQVAMDVAASLLEAAGTSATRRGHPLERLFRDARCGSLQPATSDVCADWLGAAALGQDPEVGTAMVSAAALAGSGHAFPGSSTQDELWDGFFGAHFGQDRLAHRVFQAAGVGTRHAVVNPLAEDVSMWSTGQRMTRFVREALPLGKDAVSTALADADLDATEVGLFAVVSCTGYSTPGLDILLARDLGMAADLQRLFVGHMGCYAALPALGSVGDFVAHRGRPAVLLCLELTSLHLQPAPPASDHGAGRRARVVQRRRVRCRRPPRRDGAADRRRRGRHRRRQRGADDWDVTDLGFRMGLSAQVPEVLATHVRAAVESLLGAHGLRIPDVAGWAVHPGGPRILDVVRDRLGLDELDLAASREVLRAHGNCSSATVLVVLDELERTSPTAAGEHVVALAFGPGLTMYAVLLRRQ